jgi:hypothetical protein
VVFYVNKEGQAFSVFKLLIAAVVAIAILGILLSILGGWDPFRRGNPSEKAIALLKQIGSGTASEVFSDTATFQYNSSVNRKQLADAMDLDETRVCVHPGIFLGKSEWKYSAPGKKIAYLGTGERKARFVAMCSVGNELIQDIEDYGQSLKSEWASYPDECECSDPNDPNNIERCCIIALVRSVS